MREDEEGNLRCIRGDTLYHDIECPDRHYKVTEEEFRSSCERAGLPCKEGYECYCKPCIEAFEVDVFEWNSGTDDGDEDVSLDATEMYKYNRGCDKMSLCGTVEQRSIITFRVVDNVKRDAAVVEALMHLEDETAPVPVTEVPGVPFTYEFRWSPLIQWEWE